MGLVFTFIGLLLIVTGAQNTYADFGNTLKGDLTGQGNFTYWMAAILMIGVLGYIPSLNRFSHWFLALILLSLFLSHKGFFSKFQAALASGPTAPNVSGSKGNAPLGLSDLLGNNTNKAGEPTIGGQTFNDMLKSIIPNFSGGSNVVPNSATLPF